MPDIVKIQTNGWRTPTAASTSRSYTNGVAGAVQAPAGPFSCGLISGSVAAAYSLQFGTGPTDGVPNTSFTATPTEQISGSAPEKIEIEADGSHSAGYGRIRWDARTKILTMKQFADDALVSSCPRFQYYFHGILHDTCYYRFVLRFKLGSPDIPWPVLRTTTRNNVLIFQVNPDVGEVPPFNIQVRAPSNGLETHRNLVFLRRTDNYSNVTPGGPTDGQIGDGTGESYVCIIENIRVDEVHDVCVDFRPHWLDRSAGGSPYIAIWYNGGLQKLHPHSGGGYFYDGYNIYPTTAVATGNVIHLPMIGIYRVNYTGVKAPDHSAIQFLRAEMQYSYVRPRLAPNP